MSKRGPGANFGGDEERYGKSHSSDTMADNGNQARPATAAQMARRKIAQAKSSGRRSASPAVSTGPIGTTNTQFQLPTPGANAGGFSFSFGATNTAFGQQPHQNGSPAPFQSAAGSQTQPGGTNIFAQPNTNSFATSFNSTSTQPQQNGFAPSISASFGQQQPNPSFSQFGQQQPSSSQPGQSQPGSSSFTFGQTQPNGVTSATSTSSIFKSFGQQNDTNGQNGTSFQFNQSQPQKEDPKPANIFSAFGQKPQENGDKSTNVNTSSLFGNSIQPTQPQNGDKNVFGTGASNSSFTPGSLGTSNIFGNLAQKPLSNGDKPLFSSTPFTQETPKSASGDLFGTQETPKPASSNAFGSQETSKPASSSIFSNFNSQPQPNGGASDTVQHVPSTPMFGGLGQSQVNGVKSPVAESQALNSTAFGQTPATQSKKSTFGIAQEEEQTPRPSNIFAAQSQAGQPQADTSMTTPDQTPQKSIDAPAPAWSELSSSSAAPPRSLFDRIDKNESEKALGRTSTPPLFSFTSSEQPAEIAQKSLFSASTPSFVDSTAKPSTPKPSTQGSMFQPIQTSPAKSLLDRAPPPAQPEVQRPSDSRNAESFKPTITSLSVDLAATNQISVSLTPQQRRKLKGLNSGLLQHLQAADRERDWSKVFSFYQQQVAQICSGQGAASSSSKVTGSASAAPQASTIFSATQTPKPNASSISLFSKPPETAPVQKKRLFEDNDDDSVQPPATEKRVKVNEPMSYPKLPESASNTAKLFEAALDKPKSTLSTPNTGFTSSASSLFSSSVNKQSSESLTKASTGFQPTGFQPTFSAPTGGNDMFAAFGKAAKAQEEKDRSKRKAEDYDSDDETPEEWEKRDQEEQERKRAKIAEAAKGGMGFKFTASATGGSSSKVQLGNGSTATETPKAQTKSLFDRITPASPPKTAPSKPSIFTTQTPDQTGGSGSSIPATAVHKSTASIFDQSKSDSTKPNSNIFGFLRDQEGASQLGEDVEKEQGTGDKTFKPNTPIKFGGSAASNTPAAAPPKFAGLFGSTAPPPGISLSEAAAGGKLAPPSTGFAFGAKKGSLDVSRATTPGITTDGEGSTATGADDADGEDQDLPQVEDQTALQPEEKKANDVLFELGEGKNALCKKYEDRQGTKEWVSKGKGRLYIVKNKTSGKVRIMLKIAPFGKLAMNYEPVKGIEYKVSPGAGKTVSGAFFDHLHVNEPKLGQFTVQVKEADDAKEIARILNDATPK